MNECDLEKVLGAWFELHTHHPGGQLRAGSTAPCPQPAFAGARLALLQGGRMTLSFPLWNTWMTRVVLSPGLSGN